MHSISQWPNDGDGVGLYIGKVYKSTDWLSAWENFIEFCHHENFKTHNSARPIQVNWKVHPCSIYALEEVVLLPEWRNVVIPALTPKSDLSTIPFLWWKYCIYKTLEYSSSHVHVLTLTHSSILNKLFFPCVHNHSNIYTRYLEIKLLTTLTS